MTSTRWGAFLAKSCCLLVCLVVLLAQGAAAATGACTAARERPLVPMHPEVCALLEPIVRKPGALPLGAYEKALGDYLRNYCHRSPASGWKRDKWVRDTGPYVATLQNGQWQGSIYGTHGTVVIWYSKDMMDWLKVNRPADERQTPANPAPVPDGAIMVKEMFPAPAAACAGIDPLHLYPSGGAAVMVRDSRRSRDGWFWGYFAWKDWTADWPAPEGNPFPNMGFGQYCVNCHASAQDNSTFSSLRNIQGEPGEPIVYLSQSFFQDGQPTTHHALVSRTTDDPPRLEQPLSDVLEAFTSSFKSPLRAARAPSSTPGGTEPSSSGVTNMPSQTYDNVWVNAPRPGVANEFLTSSQCIGCHDAGSTGLQYDMTQPNPHASNLLNLSPYGLWSASPMGLAGRDPFFFAQLASETQTFHPQSVGLVQDTCLGCHGVLGQRQSAIDQASKDTCTPFSRDTLNAVPWPAGNPSAPLAPYGALGREGVSCTACHRMVMGEKDIAPVREQPQNHCVKQRQQTLNPDNTGFARTFTGSYWVGPPDSLYGPFEAPKVKPMDHALGMLPRSSPNMLASEQCGTCHTVHLPVLSQAQTLGYVYEQTTYPEWAFSDYRTGTSPDGPLPLGAGPLAQSCQDCHMPSRDTQGRPVFSKIASIQEKSNFPLSDYTLGREDLDLPVREGYARHTLVGLNVFLLSMAEQYPDVLGLRTQDPMMASFGLEPMKFTQQAMVDQASTATALVQVGKLQLTGTTLEATVTVTSKTGHKFPSGVQFRRAFIEFDVLDANGAVLWASGRTNDAGVLVDEKGTPITGEFWWKNDCSGRLGTRPLQPHYQLIERQDQAQIYQELVSAPPPGTQKGQCGATAKPTGELTTSFLSICAKVKDNRILPHGFLKLEERERISQALGAGRELAEDVAPTAVGDDPDYASGGEDSLVYRVNLSQLSAKPASVQATVYYQATPPFFLQDRFCTAQGPDTQRLYYLAEHLNLAGTPAENWKLQVVTSGSVPVR